MNRLARLVLTEPTSIQIRRALLIAVILQWVIVGLYVFDIIPQQFHRAGYPFWFHQGGDDTGYESAQRRFAAQQIPARFPAVDPALYLDFTAES